VIRVVRVVKAARVGNSLVSAVNSQEKTIRDNLARAAKVARVGRAVKAARVDNSLVSAVSSQEKTIRDNLANVALVARVASPVKVASRVRAAAVRVVKAARIVDRS